MQATLMVMQVGQFLDHDIALTPESEVHGCCTDDALNGIFPTGCFPILIPNADPKFANLVSQSEKNAISIEAILADY